MSGGDDSELVLFFTKAGLTEQRAKETAKNKTLSSNLKGLIERTSSIKCGGGKSKTQLLYHIATKLKQQVVKYTDLLIEYIDDDRIANETQLNAAFDYLLEHPTSSEFVKTDFERCCGVGVVVSADDVEDVVSEVIAKNEDDLRSRRYAFPLGKFVGEVRARLKWSDAKMVKDEVDLQVRTLLGPRTAADSAEHSKMNGSVAKVKELKSTASGKEKKKRDVEQSQQSSSDLIDAAAFLAAGPSAFAQMIGGDAIKFHKVGENYKTDGYVITPNTMQLLKQHVAAIGGRVHTRFPPEPNGILHIGHAKAINFNFGFARSSDGFCYLRYDDTNPEKEEEKFFTGILSVVKWLGYEPFKVSHASDYFDELYELAKELIRRGEAYVCHQRLEDIRGLDCAASPWRNRPVADSLKLFEDMKSGQFDEGEATLRMKHVMEDGKQDPVAYRIKYAPHHRTGDKWCIYPTYDFTHCLCDSLENITHSLCTKEFQARRSSYYWLCNALDVYCPVQWEYGRLNLNYTVVSKRKIQRLISEGVVDDWDDPRLFTLTALRRRGLPPDAINLFCARVGVTQSQTVLDPSMLDACVRDVLNLRAHRVMAVLEPLEVRIDESSLDSAYYREYEVANIPGDQKAGSHRVAFSSRVFIDSSDFLANPTDKSYKRLSMSQPVGLKHCNVVITVTSVVEGKDGMPKTLLVKAAPITPENKPKGFIQWVSADDSVRCECRLFNRLFKSKNPEENPNGLLADCCPDSLIVKANALVEGSVARSLRGVYECFQFERLGYFSLDTDSSLSPPVRLVFNRTVGLREDKNK